MDKKLLKFLKNSRLKNHRSIIAIFGKDALYKIPELYKIVVREKSHSVMWYSDNSAVLRKIGWDSEENTCSPKDDNISIPEVIHISDSNIQNISLQPCYFAVIQDKENCKPSNLAHIVESVSGKGTLVFIFSKIKDLNKFTSPDDYSSLKSKFMRRLIASFSSCSNCLLLDDKLNIISVPKCRSDQSKTMVVDSQNQTQEKILSDLVQTDEESSEVLEKLAKICSTDDQTKFLTHCFEVLKRRTLRCTVSASSTKGRGKSLVLGLAIAGAIALKYSNIFISSLNYNNVRTVFKYLLAGLDAMQYKEDEDYDIIQSVNPKFNNVLLGLNIFRDHPQAIRFLFAGDVENKLEQAELVVIDEAAAIPLPLLKKLLGPYIVLMSSTTEGSGGSGKYLCENMISEIRHSLVPDNQDKAVSLEALFPTSETCSWKQIVLTEPTNYSNGDEMEQWINQALCLECRIVTKLSQGCPAPDRCKLFYVCKETLFSYEPFAEKFLQHLMSLFFCTKRIISPNILQEIADDNNYHIFCLLPPFDSSKNCSYEILCAILVHTEKHVPLNVVYAGINQFENLQDCFNEWTSPSKENAQDFLSNQGIHIVDIVTHPYYRKMGYGSCALQYFQEFHDGKCISLDDKPAAFSLRTGKSANENNDHTLPLLLQLTEVEPPNVDYMLISYYLTSDLLRFWKRGDFVPIYISSEKNAAQEHLCMMLKIVGDKMLAYLKESWRCFCEYYFLLLSSDLKHFSSELALNLLNCKFNKQLPKQALTKEDIDIYLKPQNMKSLEKYCQNLGDLHCIVPCVPILAKLFFRHRFVGVEMPVAQQVILLAFGIQHKTIDEISADFSLHSTQVHGLLNRTVRKLTQYLNNIIEKTVEKTLAVCDLNMVPIAQTLDDELEEAARKIKEKQLEDLKKLKEMDFSEFAIKGSQDDWEKALHSGRKTLVSIKSIKKTTEQTELPSQEKNKSFKHKKKNLKRKR